MRSWKKAHNRRYVDVGGRQWFFSTLTTFPSENERSWLDFRGSEVRLDRQNTDVMERERWKSQEEGCWRGAVPGKVWGQEHELKGQTYLGVEEGQEAGEVHTEVGRV